MQCISTLTWPKGTLNGDKKRENPQLVSSTRDGSMGGETARLFNWVGHTRKSTWGESGGVEKEKNSGVGPQNSQS